MTLFWTILAGVAIFVVGQFILKLVIEPIQEFKKTIGRVAHALTNHANVYTNPAVCGREVELETSRTFRSLSSELSERMALIPAYRLTGPAFGLPTRANIVEASSQLIRLSNGFTPIANLNIGALNAFAAQRIRNALRIYTPKHLKLNVENEKKFLNP